MQQIRIFKGVETELRELERDINGWLQESHATIVNIFGNISPQSPSAPSKVGSKFSSSDIMIAIVYEKD